VEKSSTREASSTAEPSRSALAQWLSNNGFPREGVNRQDGKGMTPLLKAASQGDVAVIRELIAEGAEVNATNGDGNNAIWLASAAQSLDAIESLIAAGVDVNHRNPDGATALIYAASAGKRDVVALLLRLGGDPMLETVDGFSALDLASTEECLFMLRDARRRRNGAAPAAPQR
jgi:uncharacterized protein